MKKNQTPAWDRPDESYAIKDYGHNQSTPSPGRRYKGARRESGKSLRAVVFSVLILALAAAAFALWPSMPWNRPTETTILPTTGTTSETTVTSATTSASVTETTASETTSAAATIPAEERAARLEQVGQAITELLESKPGRFGVCYRNLANSETWQYQADQPFVAASSIKLGFMTVLYKEVAEGKVSLDENLTFDKRAYPTGDFESGTGSIQGMADGTVLTVRETARLAIRLSDNCGTNMILRRLGGVDAVNAWLKTVSSVVDYRSAVTYTDYFGNKYTDKKHRTSATDLSAYAAKLYELWQASPSDYDLLLEDLSNTEFNFGIQKGVPPSVRVAHKIGTNGTYSAENDVGIVFASEPYVLCVMTEMSSAEAARKIQADISEIIYEYIESMHESLN